MHVCCCDLSVCSIQKQADEKAALLKARLEKRRKPLVKPTSQSDEAPKAPPVSKSPEIPFISAPSASERVPAPVGKPSESEPGKREERPIRPSKGVNKFVSCVTAGEALTNSPQPPQQPAPDVLPRDEAPQKGGTFVKDKNPSYEQPKPDSDSSVRSSFIRFHSLF